MRIRLFGFDGKQVNEAECLLRSISAEKGEQWTFVGVFEMLEVARKNIPPDGIGIEADNIMVFRGRLDEEKALALVKHILIRFRT